MKQRYYIRILFFLFVASLVPTLWLAGFFYGKLSDLITRAEEESAIHYLEQISHTTDLIMKNLEDTVHLLRMNNDFSTYQRLRDKNYFRKFQDHYNLERIGEYSQFLKLRTGINRNLEQFATTTEYIQSVYFYDPQVREVFSMEYIPTPIQTFPHREWYEELAGMKDKTIIGPVLNRDRQKILYLVYPQFDDSEMVFIVNLNLNLLYDFLWKQIEPKNMETFFITDRSGNPLIYNVGDEKRIRSLAWTIDGDESGLREISFDRETLLVSTLDQDLSGFVYHALNDRSQFTVIIRENRLFMALVLLPLLVVNIILLFILRSLLYKPIGKVMNHLSAEKVESLDTLEEWIDNTVSERDSREELLSRTVPAFQVDYLNRALDGELPDNYEERTNNLPFQYGEVKLFCFFTEDEAHMNRACDALSKWAGSLAVSEVCLRKDKHIFLIAEDKGQPFEEVCSRTDTFLMQFYRDASIRLYGAAGSDSWRIKDLKKGKEQVLRALKDYLKMPFGTPLIDLGRPCAAEAKPLTVGNDFIDELISRIKEGEISRASELLEHRFALLDEESDERPPSEVQHFYIHLVNSLLMRLRDQGYDIYFNEPGHEDLFVALINLRTRESIRLWISGMLEDLAGKMNESHDKNRAKNYISTAEALIESQLGDNISLSIIAEQMNISTFYLSRLFKEVRNESFTDYLRVVRMKRARQLLEDRSLKIKDVSARVGYWSSNYFIKVFRKHYGVTPGEFRNTLTMGGQ